MTEDQAAAEMGCPRTTFQYHLLLALMALRKKTKNSFGKTRLSRSNTSRLRKKRLSIGMYK
jgi:hypothetical protein